MTDRPTVRRHIADLTPRELAELELRTSAVEIRLAKTWHARWVIFIEEITNLSTLYIAVGVNGEVFILMAPWLLAFARARQDLVMLALVLILTVVYMAMLFGVIPAVTFIAARRIWRGTR